MAFWDYLVIGCYVVLMVWVGYYYSRRSKNTEDYMLGSRNMSAWKVGVSLFSATFSTVSYLMVPGEVIQNGPGIAWMLLAIPIEAAIICIWIIPLFMKRKIVSAYELLEQRLGIGGRMFGSILFLAPKITWMALILFLTSQKVLIPALGWPEWSAVLVCIIMGMITVAYATMGGIRAVVMTDVIQAGILFAGAVGTVIYITVRMGGVGWFPTEWAPNWDVQPVFSWDPYVRMTIVGMLIYHISSQVMGASSDQLIIQRSLVTRNTHEAQKMYWMNAGAGIFSGLLLPVVGFALLGFFQANPELLGGGLSVAQDGDKIFPYFIVNLLPVGMTGLLISALLAAAMGSISSGVNAISSVVMTDFVDRYRTGPPVEMKRTRQSKLIAFSVGVLAIAISLLLGRISGNIVEVCAKSLGLFMGSLFTLFFVALMIPWGNALGAIWAAINALVVAIIISFWDVFTGNPPLSFTLIMPVSGLVGMFGGTLLSGLSAGPLSGVRRVGCHSIGAIPVIALIVTVIQSHV